MMMTIVIVMDNDDDNSDNDNDNDNNNDMFILTAGYRDVALRKFFNFSLGFFICKERFCLVLSR